MNSQFTPLPARCVLIGATLLLAFVTPILAQGVPGPPADRTNSERARQQDISRREYQLRNFGTQPVDPSDRKQLEALMLQVEQDFNRILTLHNQIARATSSDQPLTYSFVSEAAAEIRKRASRLQTTLALSEPDNEQKHLEKSAEFRGTPLNDALLMLCKQIKSFVTNPVIETPGTVNVKQLEAARRDLASIIRLSAHIKKDADKLSKTVQ